MSAVLLLVCVFAVSASVPVLAHHKTALVAITNGTDTIEAVITIDILRRAGVNVTIGTKHSATATGNWGITLTGDAIMEEDMGDFDAIIFPGGEEAARFFAACEETGRCLKKAQEKGKVIAAICAAPLILKAHCIYEGKKITSGPKVADEIKESGKYEYSEDRVVVDDNLITSRTPGTAFEFALEIVKKLEGEEKKAEIEKPLLLK